MYNGSKCRLSQLRNPQILLSNVRIMEGEMSLCTYENVTNNHELSAWNKFGRQFQVWFTRWRQRDELSHWSDRDLHDVGLSWSDVIREAEKPFWRA